MDREDATTRASQYAYLCLSWGCLTDGRRGNILACLPRNGRNGRGFMMWNDNWNDGRNTPVGKYGRRMECWRTFAAFWLLSSSHHTTRKTLSHLHGIMAWNERKIPEGGRGEEDGVRGPRFMETAVTCMHAQHSTERKQRREYLAYHSDVGELQSFN